MRAFIRLWWETSHWWLAVTGFLFISAWIGPSTFLGGIGFVWFWFTLYFLALSLITVIRACFIR